MRSTNTMAPTETSARNRWARLVRPTMSEPVWAMSEPVWASECGQGGHQGLPWEPGSLGGRVEVAGSGGRRPADTTMTSSSRR